MPRTDEADAMTPFLRLAVFAAVVLAGGCGRSETRVGGTVKFQNALLTRGTVILVDATGVYHQGTLDAGGNFAIDRVAVGPAKIGVTVPKVTKPADPKPAGKPREVSRVTRDDAAKPAEDAGPPLPPAVADPATSGITRDIQPGEPLDIVIP